MRKNKIKQLPEVRVIYKGEETLLGRFGLVSPEQELFLTSKEWGYIQRKGEPSLYEPVEIEEIDVSKGGVIPPEGTGESEYTAKSDLEKKTREELFQIAEEIADGSELEKPNSRTTKANLIEFILGASEVEESEDTEDEDTGEDE